MTSSIYRSPHERCPSQAYVLAPAFDFGWLLACDAFSRRRLSAAASFCMFRNELMAARASGEFGVLAFIASCNGLMIVAGIFTYPTWVLLNWAAWSLIRDRSQMVILGCGVTLGAGALLSPKNVVPGLSPIA